MGGKSEILEGQPRLIKIEFGILFTSMDSDDIVRVIVDVGKNNFFETGTVYKDENGERMVYVGGTTNVNQFGKNIGQLSEDEFISAVKRGSSKRGYETDSETINMLRELAKKKPRSIVVK